MRTENIFNKVNIPRSLLYPIDKTQTITGRVRIDTYWGSHWPAKEIWSVSEDRPSLRSISKPRKSEGKFMANLIKN